MRPGPNGPETENQEIAIRGISVKNAGRDVQVAIRSTFCAGRISALHGRDSSTTLHEKWNLSRQESPLADCQGLHYCLGSRARVSAVYSSSYIYSDGSLVGLTLIVVCFGYTYHSAGEPSAAASANEEGDIRLAGASNRKSPQAAPERGIALCAQRHKRSIHQCGIHARRVTDEGTFDAGDAVRCPDGVSGCEHQAIDGKSQ